MEIRRYRASVRIGWVSLLSFALCAALLYVAAAPAKAKQPGDIYAVADLLPEGETHGGPPPATGPYGTATFERVAGGTRVTVVMLRLDPGSRHVNHVHDGSCTGPILHPLQTLEADATGMAQAVTELPVEVEFGRWFVNVHATDTLPSPGIACGSVNPAMAGAPPIAPPSSGEPGGGPGGTPGTAPGDPGGASAPTGELPGMPRTGQVDSPAGMLLLVLAAGILLSAAGIFLVRSHTVLASEKDGASR